MMISSLRRVYVHAIIMFALCHALAAQKQNHIWYFGNNAGLDFKTAPPTALAGQISTVEGVATIADQNGDLLFYTDGTMAWDRRHKVMPNGDGLVGGFSSTQSAVIVPLPNSCTKYYLFTAEDQLSDGGVAYSVVDMSLNYGYGDIIPSTKNTLMVEKTAEKLTAVMHANGTDVWILTHTLNTNDFYAFLLTENGLDPTPVISSVGAVYGTEGWFNGPIRSSHDGTRIVHSATFRQVVEMFDFNTTSGVVSNPVDLYSLFNDERIYGVEFSPNDSLLYLGAASTNLDANTLSQVNLFDDTLEAVTIGVVPAFSVENYGTFQLGPDGKIYIARNRKSYVDVIHQPNSIGAACQYEEESIALLPGTGSTFGLPNPAPFSYCPTYYFGPDTSLCTGQTLEIRIPLKSTDTCPASMFWGDGSSDTSRIISSSGVYWMEVTNSCFTYRDSIRIQFDSVLFDTVEVSICNGESHEGYTVSGMYQDTFPASAGCDSVRILQLTVHTQSFTERYESIYDGFTFEGYRLPGVYQDTFENVHGCDSIRILHLTVLFVVPIVEYSLDSCVSVMAYGTHMDYSEFTPGYPATLPCADVEAAFLYRNFPEKHSCTPGIGSSPAMCVGTLNSCTYQPGHSASVIIEFTIDPQPDSIVHVGQLTFYEKSPLQYEWINGPTGQNERVLKYGVRILKNGVPVFQQEDNQTGLTWRLQTFHFIDSAAFYVDTFAHFQIELLPYCRSGVNAAESVWDLDEITIYGGCITTLPPSSAIRGTVSTKSGQGLAGVVVEVSDDSQFSNKQTTITLADGRYNFENLTKGKSYYVRCLKNDDVLNGVNAIDLLKIHKHLLGIDVFWALDQFVAADVNHSDAVSVFDLVDLRKTLLGMHAGFPNNMSWRFGVLPQDFSTTDLTSFQEVKFIESLDADIVEINFMGIKVGDTDQD